MPEINPIPREMVVADVSFGDEASVWKPTPTPRKLANHRNIANS